jgi:hypothetical protein
VKQSVLAVLNDLARLRLPVTAAAAVTTMVGLLEPFGIDLSAQTTRVTAALTLVGLLSSLGRDWVAGRKSS